MDLGQIALYVGFVYGVLALIVKTFPTVPAKFPIILTIIKLLGNLTNRQTDDDAIRAEQK
jgi:hypothetical protein